MTDINSEHAKLALNASGYHYDEVLDPIADLIEQGAWKDVPPRIIGVASVQLDLRNSYRAAVKAGAIPDDRNADTHNKEK